MCFNWKVLAGLGAAGVALYALRPDLVVPMLPLLLMAACPLSMLFMGKAMSGQHSAQPATAATDHAPARAAAAPAEVPAAGRDEEVVRLRAELEALNAKQAELARQIEQLDGAAAPSKALQEAEEVARAAESRR